MFYFCILFKSILQFTVNYLISKETQLYTVCIAGLLMEFVHRIFNFRLVKIEKM